MKIAWLGFIISFETQNNNNAISLASNYWQEEFVKALESLSVKTTTISTMPHRAFPFGPLLVRPNANDFINKDFILYDYLNVKGFRDRSESYGISRSLTKLNNVDAIVSYNPYPSSREASAKFSLQHQLPWVEVCADSWETSPGWERIYKEEKVPDGYVFLSAEAYKRCPFENKILIHGGIPVRSESDHHNDMGLCLNKSNDSVTFLYSGSFEYWSGLTLLLKAFIGLPIDKPSSLIVCGYGPLSASDRALIDSDCRIQFFGTVSKSDLNSLREKADILVNPRPSIAENVFNFPSKLLEYMSYGKLIVSTKTPGIPTDFSDLMLLTNDSLSDFSSTLLEASQMTEEQRKPILNKLAVYSATHTWLYESKRLVTFIKTLIKEPR
jgi:glycosyltransferase involved in cell wall biosynthesis